MMLLFVLKDKSLYLDSKSKINTKKQKEIRKQINAGIRDLAKKHIEFMKEVNDVMREGASWAWRTKSFLKKHEKRVSKKLKSINLKFEQN